MSTPFSVGPFSSLGIVMWKRSCFFFQHLSSRLALADSSRLPVFGSDEEDALRNAMELLFPLAFRLSCMRHLTKNFDSFLSDKVGLPCPDRTRLLERLVGQFGMMTMSASNHVQLADQLQLVAEDSEEQVRRYMDRVSPLLVENRGALERPGLCQKTALWTSNNCESMNPVLKQAVRWRSLKLVELVKKLHEVIKAQYREVKWSFGDFGSSSSLLQNTNNLQNLLMCGTPKTRRKRKTHKEVCWDFQGSRSCQINQCGGENCASSQTRREETWPNQMKAVRKNSKHPKKTSNSSPRRRRTRRKRRDEEI